MVEEPSTAITSFISNVSRARCMDCAENALYLKTQCCNYWDSPCCKLEITAEKLEIPNFYIEVIRYFAVFHSFPAHTYIIIIYKYI